MRIFLVNGAPRRGGFTTEIAESFNAGATAVGGEVDHVVLDDVDVRRCRGCFHCWTSKRGDCIQKDDMESFIERFYECDTIVFATPVYFYAISSSIKIFIERMLPVTKPEAMTTRKLGMVSNALRSPDKGPKRAVLIAVGAHRDPMSMHGIVATYDLIVEALDLESAGKLLRTESHVLDFGVGKPILVRKVKAAFESAGREVVQQGYISLETERTAALPLSRDTESFNRYFSTYWKLAREIGASGSERERIRRAVSEDLRFLMPELATHLDPAKAEGLEAVILFDLDGRQPGQWHLVVSNGICEAVAGSHDSPTTKVHTNSETFVDIMLQRIDPKQAFMQGKLKVSGDKELFARFGRLFPPPSE